MDSYRVRKLELNRDIEVEVPGSKSITNRALLLAALSGETTLLRGALFSDDCTYFIKALKDLGFEVADDVKAKTVQVKGLSGRIPKESASVYVGSAGTGARFLTAMLALSGGNYVIDASPQMAKRPMKPLFEALETLGCSFEYRGEPYHLPVRTRGRKDSGENTIVLDTDESTQYLSAMLILAPTLPCGLKIRVTGSRKTGAYVNITRKMMNDFGCDIKYENGVYEVCGSGYRTPPNFTYTIEPDVSAACYFYALAAIHGIGCTVKNVHSDSMQGDLRFLKVLEDMGCTVSEEDDGLIVHGPEKGRLSGVCVDMKNFSDQALTLAAIAMYADSETVIENVAHIRHQESDRLNAIYENLTAMGVKSEPCESGIKIYPGTPKPCEVETYDDHRVAMSFAVTGTGCGGITIKNPGCCRKTFADFFEVLDRIFE